MIKTFITTLFALVYFSISPVSASSLAEKPLNSVSKASPVTSHYQLTKLGRRYFAIAGCYKYKSSARRRANKINGRVIQSSNYANLPKWRHCAVRGLYWKWWAKYNCRKMRKRGYDCYIKAAY